MVDHNIHTDYIMMTFLYNFLVCHHKISHFCIKLFLYIYVTHKNMFHQLNKVDYFLYIVLYFDHNIDLIYIMMCMRYILLVVNRKIGHLYMLILLVDIYFVFMNKFHYVRMCLLYLCKCSFQVGKFVLLNKYFHNVMFHC